MTLDAARQQLGVLCATTDRVELGPWGYMAVVTEGCRAFRALAADRETLARLEPDLVRVMHDGSSAAIVYAALLLRGLGRDVAPLLAPYHDDPRPCTVFPDGCMGLMQSLAEASRWATHCTVSRHPMRLTASELDTIANAAWFELPSAAVLAAAPTRERNDRAAHGTWVFSFAELLVAPAVVAISRSQVEALLPHAEPQVRLYAALLVRALDGLAGQRALAALAAAGGNVDRLHPGLFNRRRTRPVPVADVVAELAAWP
jgi:hypothetical protein